MGIWKRGGGGGKIDLQRFSSGGKSKCSVLARTQVRKSLLSLPRFRKGHLACKMLAVATSRTVDGKGGF